MNWRFAWQKTVRRFEALPAKQRRLVWIGAAVTAISVLLMNRPDSDERRTVFQREAALDFKGAEILGDSRQSILQGQESLFSKTQRNFLASESELKSQIAALQAEVDKLKVQSLPSPAPSPSQIAAAYGPQPLTSPSPTLGAAAPGVVPGTVRDELHQGQAAPERPAFDWNSSTARTKVRPGVNMISFPVKTTGKAYLKKPGVILPSGSYVKATLLTGVEAPEGKSYPVLLQLDYAYVIPNDKRLDLAGCFMIAKAQGDLSTERVQMQATKLSCVSRRAGMFEREVNGFVADDTDNSFAVIGSVNSKQDRVAATAFLASVVAGIGKAIQQAQTTSQVTPLGGSQTVLTGDQTKFIAAGGASDAAGMVAQWYLKQAQNLLPTINVGSGQNVWVIMQDQVDLPKEYFTQNGSGGTQNASLYSYFTHVLD